MGGGGLREGGGGQRRRDLTASPKRYVVATTLSDMEGMVGVKPSPGSVYILSSSEPYNEEMELDMQRLIEWLDFYGMPLYHIHVSGHVVRRLRSLVGIWSEEGRAVEPRSTRSSS